MGVPKGFTQAQHVFCKHYSIHLDADRAALEAGVPFSKAREWLDDEKFQERVARERGVWIVKSGVSPEEIIAHVATVMRKDTAQDKDRLSAGRLLADIFGLTTTVKATDTLVNIKLGSSKSSENEEEDDEVIQINEEYNDYSKPKKGN